MAGKPRERTVIPYHSRILNVFCCRAAHPGTNHRRPRLPHRSMIAIDARPGPRGRALRHHHWLHLRPTEWQLLFSEPCGVVGSRSCFDTRRISRCQPAKYGNVNGRTFSGPSRPHHRYQRLRAVGKSRISLNHFRAAAQARQGRMHSWGRGQRGASLF